jgi:alanine racemase
MKPSRFNEPLNPQIRDPFRDRINEQDARVLAHISAQALKNNYAAIQALVPGQAVLPMIKANAYGHGAAWVARTLAFDRAVHGLYGFGVATLEEGFELRSALGVKGRKVRIMVFSGCTPWTETKGAFCEAHGLTAVIETDSDWRSFYKGGWAERLSYEIMFNTGMNRLGLSPPMAATLAKELRNLSSDVHPEGIFSHLACAEDPAHKLSQAQLACFNEIQSELAPAFPKAHFHLANSAAIWNQKRFGYETDVVRPGLSLYGIPPWKGAPARDLVPLMNLEAKVIQIATLKPGDSIGYGALFRAKESTRYAVLAMGYADGLSRALGASPGSEKKKSGSVLLRGERCQMIGRVSMDLAAIRAPALAKVGDWARLLGEGLDHWELAEIAGTIPYEILTSVSSRVQRIYD